MSSILKALKKLEDGASDQDVFIPWPQHIRRKRGGIAEAGRNGITVKTISLIVAALIIVVFSAIWFWKKQGPYDETKSGTIFSSADEKKITPVSEPKTTYHPPGSALEKKPLPVSKKDPTFVTKADPEKPTTGTPENRKEKMPATPTVVGPLKQKEVTPAAPVKEPNQGKKFESLKKAKSHSAENDNKPSGPIVKPDKEKSASLRKKQSSPIELMDETRLKLDAIAWSDDPKKRIAVINGRIVREKESIEGYVVVRIDAEEVVVREGRKSWRLVFRIH